MTRPDAISSIHTGDHLGRPVLQPVSIERRSRVRFPLGLRVHYRTLGRGYPFVGIGQVMNMSSGGVLVGYEQEIEAGTRVELTIEWPSLLDGRIPLRLVTVGKVVRCETDGFALALSRHQFRTTRRTVVPIDALSFKTAPNFKTG